MARTPLLRALKRLAREHAAAERLGTTPAELRQRAAAASRRDVLKAALAAGALAPSLRFLPAAAATGSAPRIAIVGAGIAGLTAALTLQDKGLAADAVTLYEASSDVGGRMHSDLSGYWYDGQVSEFCGELIDSGHTTILGLAARFGLEVDDLLAAEPSGSTDTYWFGGGRYSVTDADKDFGPVRDALRKDLSDAGYPTLWNKFKPAGQMLDKMSVYEWIEKRVPGGHESAFGQLLDTAYNIEYGAETTDQSSLNLVYLLAYQPSPKGFAPFGVSDERYHIRGGNQLLPKKIKGILSSSFKLEWRLTKIEAQNDGKVKLSFDTPEGAQSQTVDRVILTVPFAVLRTLDSTGAGFDPRKIQAINELGAGRNAKLQLQFASRFWNGNGPWGVSNGSSYADLGYQNTWDVSRAQPGTSGILVNYTGGKTAAAFASSTPYARAGSDAKVTAYAHTFLHQLESVFPGISGQWTGRATLSTPFRDPNLLCSYSYWRPGQYIAFGGYEKVPQGSIHFAGEHCSQDFQGYMEGGASEGIRAALEVWHAVGGNG